MYYKHIKHSILGGKRLGTIGSGPTTNVSFCTLLCSFLMNPWSVLETYSSQSKGTTSAVQAGHY